MKSRELRQAEGLGRLRDSQLRYLLREGKVPAPPKDVSGHFDWPPESVQLIREALAADRRRKGQKAKAATA
jgi:hypothetical protein